MCYASFLENWVSLRGHKTTIKLDLSHTVLYILVKSIKLRHLTVLSLIFKSSRWSADIRHCSAVAILLDAHNIKCESKLSTLINIPKEIRTGFSLLRIMLAWDMYINLNASQSMHAVDAVICNIVFCSQNTTAHTLKCEPLGAIVTLPHFRLSYAAYPSCIWM